MAPYRRDIAALGSRGGPRPAAPGERPSRGSAVRRVSRAVPGNRNHEHSARRSVARVGTCLAGFALGPAHCRDARAGDRRAGRVAATRAGRAGPGVRHGTRTTTRGVVLRWLACVAGRRLATPRAAGLRRAHARGRARGRGVLRRTARSGSSLPRAHRARHDRRSRHRIRRAGVPRGAVVAGRRGSAPIRCCCTRAIVA